MTEIAIIGVNGQVGAELALYWAPPRPDLRVTGFLRTEYGQTLPRIVGVPCETYDVRNPDAMKRTFAAFDLVADFTYPAGRATEAIPQFRAHAAAFAGALKPGAAYVTMSSVMAFGMAPYESRVRHRRIARTAYAAIKRAGERDVARAGRATGVRCFSFRLGQVHGVLQGAGQSLLEDLNWGDVVVSGAPDDPTIAVFVPTLAQALLACADRSTPGGVYTVVESPQWTLADLYGFYGEWGSTGARYRFLPPPAPSRFAVVKTLLAGRMDGIRGPLEAYVLSRSDTAHRLAKGWYRRRGSSGAGGNPTGFESRHEHVLGNVPGPRVGGASLPAEYTGNELRRLRDWYQRLLTDHSHGRDGPDSNGPPAPQ